MYADKPARYLTEHHLDYDIVPADYLAKAELRDKTFVLSKETYPALVVPYAEYLPQNTITAIVRLAGAGVPVYIIDAMPRIAETGETADIPGGFIMRCGNIEVNCAADTLVMLRRASLSSQVAEILFS